MNRTVRFEYYCPPPHTQTHDVYENVCPVCAVVLCALGDGAVSPQLLARYRAGHVLRTTRQRRTTILQVCSMFG